MECRYSNTINYIIGAAKLTGKTKDGLSIGFVEAVTAEEKAEIDTIGGRKYETVEPLTNYMVGRVQKDINEGKTIIGGIFTSTNRDLDANLRDSCIRQPIQGELILPNTSKIKTGCSMSILHLVLLRVQKKQ